MKKVKNFLGMSVPKFGTFTNGPYRIKGVRIFGNMIGWIVESYYPMVYDIGKFVVLPEYNSLDHDDFQYHK